MEKKKIQVIKKYIFIFFILCIVLTSIFIMIRYQVEGEENMPFKLKEVIVKSSIEPKSVEEDNLWESILSQENDIFITIAKEDSAKGDTKIQKVVIDNFKIKKTSDKFNFNILLPTGNLLTDMYLDSTKDYSNEKIEYIANMSDSFERHEICEDGGQIAFRISNSDIATYKLSKNEEVVYNGDLLEKIGINEEELKFEISMDITIETNQGIKYKANINYQLPVDEFKNEGIKTKTIEDFSDVIFKRQ